MFLRYLFSKILYCSATKISQVTFVTKKNSDRIPEKLLFSNFDEEKWQFFRLSTYFKVAINTRLNLDNISNIFAKKLEFRIVKTSKNGNLKLPTNAK